ncbi:excinuclease ABC subunit UvrC [Fuchsiella alkaliacetigena]|uniref:excinuclease ABC subunit UvrC n=1 Tax=Fuchsiella alkaliacetigena TaxID=957042 RepID=UPI00200A10C6|nr:excinuclease ABC subunit UvrC [Fuchsiella alkaliacetigena]MCK8824080.1 excinuclease ABC subunit UvrC [Fuchsiella alkaliacetigena]
MNLKRELANLPTEPGVYLMKNKAGQVIYVGKAKSLRKRVRSYFQKSRQHSFKTKALVKRIADFDYLVTDSEVEALILEANLIKKHNPKFNIRLKDDKSYPYLKITAQEDYPRVFMTRTVKKDGAKYFGPYTDVRAVNKTLKLIQDLFPLRDCKKKITKESREDRPCLNYHIENCLGPCVKSLNLEQYRQLIEEIILFLEGQHNDLIKQLKQRMKAKAKERDFEEAAELRDQIEAIKKLTEQQKVVSPDFANQDIIATAVKEDLACVEVLIIRNGRLMGEEDFIMEGTSTAELAETLTAFLKQYYMNADYIPQEVVVEQEIKEQEVIEDWLNEKRGSRVYLRIPQRGVKRQLVNMAQRNAKYNLKDYLLKSDYQQRKPIKAVQELRTYLDLDKVPLRIEGFDVSNTQGSQAVASLVVFENGTAKKSDYRRFKIKTVSGPDDYAMLQEVVQRRYSRLLAEDEDFPDLILIDGGKGQLNAVRKILRKLGKAEQTVISLAKREEEVFIPGEKEPLVLPKNSEALYLLQRVRDEAHRFALNYHRRLRSRRVTQSMLDDIPGIGQKRREALLQHFGSLDKIRKAGLEELSEVTGISDKLATAVYNYLQEHTRP